MLAWSELKDWILTRSDNGYNVIVVGSDGVLELFSDYSNHPFATGRPAKHIRGNLYSTASGRYQFLQVHWRHYKKSLRLPDFGPESQDKWAIQLIRERKAYGLIVEGKIGEAISLCKPIWASLPGAGYGQHENKLSDLLERYTAAGGTLA